MLNYGQHPDTPVALFLRNENPQVNKFVDRWSEQLQIAKKCIEAAHQRQKAAADRRRRPAEVLQVGDGVHVLIHIKHFRLAIGPGLKLMLAPRYLGPFPISEILGQQKLSFRVELLWQNTTVDVLLHSLDRYSTSLFTLSVITDLTT